MTPLDDLIAYHREREQHCAEEVDRALEFKNDRLSRRSVKIWTQEKAIARDTAAWLETIKNRTLA